jgi:hypothetical protein
MSRPRASDGISELDESNSEVLSVSETSSSQLKRCTLTLPEELFNQVQQAAAERHTTVLAVLRQYIKLGLLASKIDDLDPDSGVILRIKGTDHRIILP